MKIQQFVVDAFASQVFKGNPAAVCPMDQWLDDGLMLAIAAENNLSETAFFVPEDDGYRLRWFTPVSEVNLCGHATLATAHVLFNHLGFAGDCIRFQSKGGELRVRQSADGLTMDFPAIKGKFSLTLDELVKALGKKPLAVMVADDYMAVFGSEEEVRNLQPDMALLQALKLRGVIVTAPGTDVDFVSRFFAPKLGIPEDPVTGSAHCMLTPFWATELEKNRLTARQISARGGDLVCELAGDRVLISGTAVTFLEGTIYVPA
jgi:PhzF family phenazine biosynthesis protein